ncbi:MAG TPA: sigma-70 family RNA polymerase sigma factor [Terriglobia bacterium]|nr:sigma-70 family RNA polymerase sigma factor [Terriglobia bacterium]
MSEELPPENLLARVARQDEAALSELYDRYAPRLYGLVVHILPSRDVAEEIIQEVFVRLWGESPSLSQEGKSAAAWLVITAREAAVDRLRALRRKVLNAALQGPGVIARKEMLGTPKSKSAVQRSSPVIFMAKPLDGKSTATRPDPAERARTPWRSAFHAAWLPEPKEITLIDDRLALLHKAIKELPKPQRDALELAVFGGLSESEIATATGEPLAKAQRSLRAAVTFVKHRRRAVCGTWAANI